MKITPTIPVLLVAALLGAAPAPAETSGRPNVILIMADDVGYECFGAYGSKQYKTPHLDRMAGQGIRFDHCYSQPVCTPSRVKIMTGKVNARNYSAFSILNRGERTIGHMMQEAGYRTMVAGKWQLYGAEHYGERFRAKGVLPENAGFDRHALWQVERLGDRYWHPLLRMDGEHRQFSEDKFGPDVVTDFLLDFMEQNRERPFFAYYPMILVHSPFVPTPDSAGRNSKDRQRNFEDMVAYMDKLVGRIAGKAETLGIAGRTVILFVGDNGTHRSLQSALNGRVIQGGKSLPADAGTRVPFIGYGPGIIPGGQVSGALIDFTDFVPTLLELAGAEPPSGLDGYSFLPVLKGDAQHQREWLYTYYNPRPEKTEPVRFVRDQRWKLYGDGRFFDVKNDPLEQHPLTGEEKHSQAAKARAKLAKALASMPAEGRNLLKFTP